MDAPALPIIAVALAGSFAAGFLVARSRVSAALGASATRESEAGARVAVTQRELELVKQAASATEASLANANEMNITISDARARAEAEAARIPQLEATLAERDRRIVELSSSIGDLKVAVARAEEAVEREQQLGTQKLSLLTDAEAKLGNAFKSLAAESLKANNDAFFQMAHDKLDSVRREAAEDLDSKKREIDKSLEPVRKTLESLDEHSRVLETERAAKLAGLQEQLRELSDTNRRLSAETGTLVSALRQPHVRGQWGQMTLRRVMEIAGMVNHCDFDEQVTVNQEDGLMRPDAVVHIAEGRDVVIDAKVPLVAFLDAAQASSPEDRKTALLRHVAQTRTHIEKLAQKSYAARFPNAFDHVVMFVPNDAIWDDACGADTDLLEFAIRSHVIVATPMTLLVVLFAVAQSWRQQQLAQSAAEISSLGHRLFERIDTYVDHVRQLGQRLRLAVEAYNATVGSLESRLMPVLRRFPELGVVSSDAEIESLVAIEALPRDPSLAPLAHESDACDEAAAGHISDRRAIVDPSEA
jgi:DNA recombination protein RmuC